VWAVLCKRISDGILADQNGAGASSGITWIDRIHRLTRIRCASVIPFQTLVDYLAIWEIGSLDGRF
jgi:hypothetical protein